MALTKAGGPAQNKMVEEGRIHSLDVCLKDVHFACPQTSELLVLPSSDWDCLTHPLSSVPSLQMSGRGTSWPP